MFLIVGLGNPGKFYKNNRHNIGFKIIDNIRDTYNFPDFSKKFKSEFSKSELNKNILFLLKPTTFMNNSGMPIKEIKDFYNIDINNIYVIHDEIDLDQGRVKVKNGGGHNGHNGLKSIDKCIGKNYNRVRVGVSRPSKIFEENAYTKEIETEILNGTVDLGIHSRIAGSSCTLRSAFCVLFQYRKALGA